METYREIWTPRERRVLDRLDSPRKVQDFLDKIPYDPEGGFRSPRYVLREGKAQCFTGVLFAAAVFRYHGRQPLLVELTAENDDVHMLAVFEPVPEGRKKSKKKGPWGAVSKSQYSGLRYREPVYSTIRELVMTYFDFYYNPNGYKSLRGFSVPIDLTRFDPSNWMTSEEHENPIEEAIDRARHFPVITAEMRGDLDPVDKRLLKSSLIGANWKGLYKPKR